ncbi:hypothetical protein ACE193_06135 [Bernardetia sp. OM2101]|uniref:hypothetical protein n=1 Tax=Bernardetia sp. OM2101 TaxID=3344876 RepID=UPI0035D05B94
MIRESIESHNQATRNKIEIGDYYRQYIVVKNKLGEKEVWINCFCRNTESNWRQEIVQVKDGGSCYFNLKINLSKKQHYNFRVNGEA